MYLCTTEKHIFPTQHAHWQEVAPEFSLGILKSKEWALQLSLVASHKEPGPKHRINAWTAVPLHEYHYRHTPLVEIKRKFELTSGHVRTLGLCVCFVLLRSCQGFISENSVRRVPVSWLYKETLALQKPSYRDQVYRSFRGGLTTASIPSRCSRESTNFSRLKFKYMQYSTPWLLTPVVHISSRI